MDNKTLKGENLSDNYDEDMIDEMLDEIINKPENSNLADSYESTYRSDGDLSLEDDAPEISEEVYERVRKRKSEIKSEKTNNDRVTRRVKVKYIKPKKGNRIAFSLIFTSIIVGISVIASISIIFLAKEFFGIDKSASNYTLKIPENADVKQVMEIMTTNQEDRGREPIIRVKPLFELLVKFKERGGETVEFVAGDHALSPNMGYTDILDELTSVEYIERQTVTITIVEGTTLDDVAKMLEDNGVCLAEKFIYYFNNGLSDYNFINDVPKSTAHSLRYHRMEGYLFPDTYEFYQAIDITTMEESEYEIILRKIYDNFEIKYNEELQARAKEMGMTMDEVIIMASIIQKEAADNADMYNVSSVFHNRMERPYDFRGFESDPTSEYAVWLESKGMSKDMVRAYDTYETKWYPPGAICNPGLEAIKAVLYPAQTNYLFFCADTRTKEKIVYYAETVEQHRENCIAAGIINE